MSCWIKKHAIIIPLISALAGCIEDDSDGRLDAGYSDGYAVGYNTECKIRATLIEGDFDNAYYSRGYYAGLADGAAACRSND